MKVLSLGWGVQSWTLAAMVALGEFEPVDVMIHADTTHEASWTYKHAKKWTGWLEDHGKKVITVKPDKKKMGAIDQYRGVFIPAYTTDGNGSKGQLHRQCTNHWKIAPMRREIQKIRNGDPVEMWLGITLDEFQRMKPSNVKYITNRWPLIELQMKRLDCINWLNDKGLEIPLRSACTFCPYHSTHEWQNVKTSPPDWKEAVEHDEAIRKVRPPFDLFVHPERIPLVDVDLRTAEEKGQMALWDDECFGVCGI
jgi:hypothetical protein